MVKHIISFVLVLGALNTYFAVVFKYWVNKGTSKSRVFDAVFMTIFTFLATLTIGIVIGGIWVATR